MAAFEGWSGFLGLPRPQGGRPPTLSVASLRRTIQRFPDTYSVDHASFVRGPNFEQLPPLLERKDTTKPVKGTVALIGGGIANLIAAYELSRCGVLVTMYEKYPATGPNINDKPFGGRLVSQTSGGFTAQLGADAFPARSPLFWHYVWRIGLANGIPPGDFDQVSASRHGGPGTVPTKVCFQNTWYDFKADFAAMPAIVQEAAYLVREWLLALNDGSPQPQTLFLADAIAAAKTPVAHEGLDAFWQEMRRRYDGRSFESVLAAEVFAAASDPAAVLAAFAAIGVGTGGFGPVYDIACLEILRQVVWDSQDDYELPLLRRPRTSEPGTEAAADASGVQGYELADFAQDFAVAAHAESQKFWPNRAFDDMFRFGTSVDSLCVTDTDMKTKIGVCMAGKQPELYDLAIVAVSSRAMEAMGLGQDRAGNPFAITAAEHTPTSRRAIESVQAAIHRLNMVSSYKLFARIPAPDTVPTWPVSPDGQRIRCFVTDRHPRLTYLPPAMGAPSQTLAVAAEVWGADADKLQAGDMAARRASVASAFDAPDSTPWPYAAVAQALAQATDVREIDWTKRAGVSGGVKLDRPEDDYLAASLLFQSLLAEEPNSVKQPWGRVFLAGDSVGYLGGSVEGTAQSALTATTAVLRQLRFFNADQSTVRSARLVNPNAPRNHRWQSIGSSVSALPRWKGMTALAARGVGARTPPIWRRESLVIPDEIDRLSVSQDGHWMVALASGVAFAQLRDYESGTWGGWRNLSLGNVNQPEGVLITGSGAEGHPLVYRSRAWQYGEDLGSSWSWETVPVATDVKPTAAAAVVALTPRSPESVHLALVRESDSALLYGIRGSDRTWGPFKEVPGPRNTPIQQVAQVSLDGTTMSMAVIIVVIDLNGGVQALARRADGTFDTWRAIVPPRAGMKAQLVATASAGAATRLVAKFDDGQLYENLIRVLPFDFPERWRPLPYPTGPGYDTAALAMGASIVDTDSSDSATLWFASMPKPATATAEGNDAS